MKISTGNKSRLVVLVQAERQQKVPFQSNNTVGKIMQHYTIMDERVDHAQFQTVQCNFNIKGNLNQGLTTAIISKEMIYVYTFNAAYLSQNDSLVKNIHSTDTYDNYDAVTLVIFSKAGQVDQAEKEKNLQKNTICYMYNHV